MAILLLLLLTAMTNAHATPTATTTTLKAGLTSAPATAITAAQYGVSVTLTATIGPSAAAGTVTFKIGGVAQGSPVAVSSGAATLVTTTLAMGSNSLTAAFTPTTPASYGASNSSATIVTVSQATTTTTLKAGLTSTPATPITTAQYGVSVTLTATVSPAAAGNVTFKNGGVALGSPVAVSSGTATLVTTTLAMGSNSLTAAFAPTTPADDTSSASGTTTVTVSQATTSTALAVGLTSTPSTPITTAAYGASVTLTATISPAAAGNVTFKNGGVALGSPVAVSSGRATLVTATLPVAANSLTAAFAPTTPADDTSSASGTTTLTVTKATTTTTLGVSTGPYYYGSSVTLTANVAPTAATGSVNFYDNSTLLGAGTLSSGTATLSLTTLAVGAHPTITATYVGNASYSTSPSTSTSLTVAATTTQVAVTPSPASPLAPGTSFTLTANVTASVGSATVSTGNVSFYDSSTLLGKVAVSAGTATLASSRFPSPLATGKHYLIALYGGVFNGSGTAQFAGSLSTAAQMIISGPQTITFTGPASPVTYGATAATLSATSTSGLTVSFTASGACSVSGTTLSYISAGVCTVTAVQAGSAAYTAATPVPQTVTVNTASLAITASSPAVTYGTAIPTITPGYVGFVNSDTSASLTTGPTCTTTYLTTSDPGSYPTSCSGAADANYSISYTPGSVTVTKASQTISHWYNTSTTYGTPVALSAAAGPGQTVVYTVNSGPASVNGTSLTPSGVGIVTITASAAGNTDFTAATGVQKQVTVYQAPLVVTASSPTVTFGASVPTITPSYVGFAYSETSASLTTQPRCGTAYTSASHAASAPITYCYNAVDPNYSITYTSGTVIVNQATPTVSTWPTASTITYGAVLSASTLSGGSGPGTFAWTNLSFKPGAGTPSESVTFTPTNAIDYSTVTNNVSVTVNKANPTVTWPTASAIAYGSALSASRFSGGSSNGAFTWTSPTTVPTSMGSNSEGVTFTPTDSTDYNTATNNVNVTVNKATPTVTWPTASSITYGQALSNSTLTGGSANTGGTFAWTNSAAVPNAGTLSESVTFTPTSTTEYSTVAHTVSVTVNKATPTVSSWPTASTITYGQTLSSSILTGGSTAGRFAWTSPTTVPSAGTPTESVTFTPTNTTDYTTTTNTVSVTVNQATPTVSGWPTASTITFGQALSNSTLTGGTASTDGTFDWTTPATEPGVGTASYSVTFTPTDATDYSAVNGWASITVNACGLQDSINSAYSTALNVYVGGESPNDLVLDAEGTNESAICAVNSNPTQVITVTFPSITSNAGSGYPADSNSYGTDAAVLAYGLAATANTGATITINDDGNSDAGSISTAMDYSNGVFASMGGTINITDTNISTSGNNAHGLEATYEGTLNINMVQASTAGNNSSVIVAGVGGGIVAVNGGTYTSSGSRSSGIRAAGTSSTVNVTDTLASTTISAQNASAVVVEGNNSVTLNSTGGGISLSGALGDGHGIYFYQGSSGDATAGTGTFTMTNGSLTYTCDATSESENPCPPGLAASGQNSPATLFSAANTTATITLTDVTVTNTTPTDTDSNGTLLTAEALDSGTPGSNGGIVTFNAYGETLIGDVLVDSISTVNLNLAADSAGSPVPSTLTGAINNANNLGATVNLTLDATSSWVVTGDSYLTSLTNAVSGNSNITCQTPGCSVYVGGVLQSNVH